MTVDVQDLLPVTATADERARFGVGPIYENAATCGACGDYIRSRNRHDFATCSCGALSVDGGSWYARRVTREAGRFTDHITLFADARGDAG